MEKIICLETTPKSGSVGILYTGRAECFANYQEKDEKCSFEQYIWEELVRYQPGYLHRKPSNLKEVRKILKKNKISF